MLRSSLCDCSDAYILVKGMITITGAGAEATALQADERNKQVIFKNITTFTECISKINTTKVVNAKELDVVMPMLNSSQMLLYQILNHSNSR